MIMPCRYIRHTFYLESDQMTLSLYMMLEPPPYLTESAGKILWFCRPLLGRAISLLGAFPPSYYFKKYPVAMPLALKMYFYLMHMTSLKLLKLQDWIRKTFQETS